MLLFRHVNAQIFACFWALLVLCNVYQILGDSTPADSWLMFARRTKQIFNKCYTNHTELNESWSCIKHNSLILFDDIRNQDVIPLLNTVALIRRPDIHLPLRRYDIGDSNEISWFEQVKQRALQTIFTTHNFKFSLQKTAGEARRRRRRFRMFPAMIFGMAVLGVVIIPLGFHIMSVIGGLALLLGKMAMLIATITSLKRLAAHGVHYGLYHTDHQYAYPPPGTYWERNGYEPKNFRT